MTVSKLRPLAVALGLYAGGHAIAADSPSQPAKPIAPATATAAPGNQHLADTVANRLTLLPAAQQSDISLTCVNGVVTLVGVTHDANLKSAILETVRVIPGVRQVRDGIRVGGSIQQVQALEAPSGTNGVVLPGPIVSQAPTGIYPSGPTGPVIEPAPLGGIGMPSGGAADAPPLPPYAWPTYAPHNNLSRVAYPQAYPHNAFPYIGPFYPFPKVPPGWRSVKLEWEDGHWWMGRTSAPHDYWRVRFW